MIPVDEERQLADRALSGDFFGPAGLRDDGPPPVPEKYVIERRLGQGASGTVYLARDTTLGRSVALKCLNLDRLAEVERFFREARVTARLRNPAIVQIYEAAENAGAPYLAMQYIPGGNLAAADLGRRGTLGAIQQVAEALAHAHDEGIVHRDVKPENILVDTDGRGFVTDFGIARDLRRDIGDTISDDGQILGTPAFMAPEQAQGDVQAVDARTDVFALGATLYYKLTDRLPFSGETLVDVLHAVIYEEPVFLRTHRADIPRVLEALVLRCLQKRAADRYGSMREVIAALGRLTTDDQVPHVVPRWFTTYVRRLIKDVPDVPDKPPPEPEWLAALDIIQEIGAWDAQLYRVGDLDRYFPQLDDLIRRLTVVLDERPSTGWARFYRGVAWFRRGEFRRALDDMERSIDRVADSAGAHFELGRLYLAIFLDEHHEADTHLSQMGASDQARTVRSRLDQAGFAFAEVQHLKHEGPAWQFRYAGAVRRLADADVDGCVAECDAILADEPDLDEVWKLKGDALRRLKRDPFPAYERALDVRRSCYEALLAMADVHLETGAVPDARTCLARALEIHSGLVTARVLLARGHLIEARAEGGHDALDAALAAVGVVLKTNPDRYDGVVTLAEIQIERARQSADPALITDALDTLGRAMGLEGCGDRVEYLRADARLTRAQLAVVEGRDPTNDLEAVLACREHEAAHEPDNERWLSLIAEAERTLAEYVR